LDELAALDARVRVIHQKNSGHGPALRAGLDQSRGERILLVDSDRQIAMEGFYDFLTQADQYDAILGVRAERHDPAFRLLLTKLVRLALLACLGVKLRDANCPFKLITRSAWLEARCLIPPDTLTPSLFLAVYLAKRRYKIKEQAVAHRERPSGVSTL